MPRAFPRLDRRRFVAGAAALPAVGALSLPAGGAFVAGSDRIRVGLVGCGGRGTGAALHALSAAAGTTLTSMADAFADQIESSAAVLAARAGTAFACPPEGRHVGPTAWRRVVESDVDLVILATPPSFRPAQAAAAVRAGRHVWCETPGAVDVDGSLVLAEACVSAAARGLSFASGLASRHDAATADLVARIRDGAAGRPLSVSVRADLGQPWVRPARPGWSPAEFALRNWIAEPRYSGGHLVEHHVAAIDRALWVLGDAEPEAILPDAATGGVRYLLADGRHATAVVRRRPGATGAVEERARCERGIVDLRRAAPGESDPLAAAMAALVAAVRSGIRLDDGPYLCRATLAAVGGRIAIERNTAVAWDALRAGGPSPVRPLQSLRS